MYLWYALIWELVEGLSNERQIRLEGDLRAILAAVRNPLRQARNAVFHVGGQEVYYDDRLGHVFTVPGWPELPHRLHDQLGDLVHRELARRWPRA